MLLSCYLIRRFVAFCLLVVFPFVCLLVLFYCLLSYFFYYYFGLIFGWVGWSLGCEIWVFQGVDLGGLRVGILVF